MEVLNSRIILRPSAYRRSLEFYRDTLGLAIYREFPGGTVFFLGQGFLELSGEAEGGTSPDLALWLQVRDVRAEFARLRAVGVTVLHEPTRQPWGLDEAWITDPDGLRIALVEVPAAHPLRRDVRQQSTTRA
jgi:catechol 2,3-dioxygenase-like lactoylglutathione lyase family enzyme